MEPEFNPEFESLIGYQFHDRGLMEESLKESGPAAAGNKRLALLGDTVLELMLLRRWYCEGNTTGKPPPTIWILDIVLMRYRARDESSANLCLQSAVDLSSKGFALTEVYPPEAGH